MAWWSLTPHLFHTTQCSPSASPVTQLPFAPLGAHTMPSLAPSHPTQPAHVPKRQLGPCATPAVNRSPLRPHTRPPRPRRVSYRADAIPYRFSSAKDDLTRARPLRAPGPPFRSRCQKWRFYTKRLDRSDEYRQVLVSPGCTQKLTESYRGDSESVSCEDSWCQRPKAADTSLEYPIRLFRTFFQPHSLTIAPPVPWHV